MELSNQKIKEILISGNYVTKIALENAERKIANTDISLIDYLIDSDILTKDLLGQAISEYEGVPFFDLNSNIPSYDQAIKTPEETARKYRIVLVKEDENRMYFASDNIMLARELFSQMDNVFPSEKIVLYYSLTEDIDSVFSYIYKKPLKTRFSEIISTGKKVAQEIIEEIFEDALSYNSSDIHFEPQEDEAIIRFRVDGVLQEAGRISREYYSNILNFVKVQSNLRIDEHNSTQDGSMKHKLDDKEVDLRISILPVVYGEKIVIRILAKYVKGFDLQDIGLSSEDVVSVKREIKRPFGMILTAGPTGSGKTTTLYSVLKLLNNPRVNITTLEDPIEYRMSGVNQTQVNSSTNLTFSKGLRSIVRQDPDIIMVGEIRDQETAEIAVNSALTGHLLFSTFHANDASTTVARLIDMGIEPFLLASTLRMVLSQRLVRRLCEKCRYSVSVSKKDLESYHEGVANYFEKEKTTIYKSHGCESCGFTGYKGRIAIFEIIVNTPEMQDLILTKPSAKQVWELAEKQGAKSLFGDGVLKVESGVTSLEDLLRVALP
ncbi:MAG: GspE/PulE family protein [Patescibacteria group bacterium]